MILYLAGNFPQLSSPSKEKEFIERIQGMGRTYSRLVTFYYKKDVETVLRLKKEMDNGNTKSKDEPVPQS